MRIESLISLARKGTTGLRKDTSRLFSLSPTPQATRGPIAGRSNGCCALDHGRHTPLVRTAAQSGCRTSVARMPTNTARTPVPAHTNARCVSANELVMMGLDRRCLRLRAVAEGTSLFGEVV